MTWIYIFDLSGTLVFAISGVLIAIEKKFDLVGSIIIGFATAIGGGTLRDLLIGETPVGWMKDVNYLMVILTGVLLSYLFKPRLQRLEKSMLFFDAMGIGLFTILGLQKTLNIGLSIPIAIMMGIVSAVFGGIIRDVLSNEIPLIFRREVYASACLLGGIVFVILEYLVPLTALNIALSILTVVVIRFLSIKRGWSLNV